MTVETLAVNNALVYRDNIYTHRWLDAFGENVVKYIQDFATLSMDDTTTDPTEWVVTVVEVGAGTSNAILTDQAGGALKITTAGNEDDGWSMQLGQAAGESVKLDGRYPLYVGCKFKINDVDQTDVLFGVAVTDTALLGGVTDGLYFRSVDASAVLNFVAEKDSVESSTAAATLADDTYIVAEYLYYLDTVTAYINGVSIGSITTTSTSFPNDEEMRLSFEFLTGEAVANTCTVEWLKMIHIR